MTLRSEDLGPRQAKAVNQAVRDFGWAAKAKTQLHGTEGKPETETRSSSVVLVGGTWRPDAKPRLDKIEAKYEGVVTKKNYQALIADIETEIAAMKADPVIEDCRITRAEEDERAARMEEWNRKETERQAAAVECWKKLDELVPLAAQALIVAELHEDDSDSMTDYYASRTVRRVVIGYRLSKREDFRHLRRAAGEFEHTRHLGPDAGAEIEHRDNYSMGAGNWLGTNRYSAPMQIGRAHV